MELEEFNKKYKYQSDKEKFKFIEIWENPKENKDGFIYADCESYCRYLKENIEQFEKWDYYYCKINGIGHCVLSNGALIIDCNEKKILLKDSFINKYKITNLKKYNKFVVFSKILFSKVFILINKITKH